MACNHKRPKERKSSDKSRDSPRTSSFDRTFRVHLNGWLQVLRESIRAVPVNRLALGAVGVASAAAVALNLFENLKLGLLATFLTLIMMFILLFFSWLSKLGSTIYISFAVAFGWLMLALLGAIFVLLLTTTAFGWPEHLRKLFFGR